MVKRESTSSHYCIRKGSGTYRGMRDGVREEGAHPRGWIRHDKGHLVCDCVVDGWLGETAVSTHAHTRQLGGFPISLGVLKPSPTAFNLPDGPPKAQSEAKPAGSRTRRDSERICVLCDYSAHAPHHSQSFWIDWAPSSSLNRIERTQPIRWLHRTPPNDSIHARRQPRRAGAHPAFLDGAAVAVRVAVPRRCHCAVGSAVPSLYHQHHHLHL